MCIRDRINPDGSIIHAKDEAGNWNAAEKVRTQAVGDDRKIWTALQGVDY